MKHATGLASVCVLTIFLTDIGEGQESVPTWRLAPPHLTIGGSGGDELALFRVTDATVLSDGSTAIADAGNHRVLVLAPDGKLVASIGREGAGPGEFRALESLSALAGDTLLTYDPLVNRVTLFLPNGDLVNAFRLPEYDRRPTHFVAARSPSQYLLATRELVTSGGRRLYTSHASILLYDPLAETLTPAERRRLDYLYFFPEQHGPGAYGATHYSLPFFGRAHIAALADVYAFVPLDSAMVELKNPVTDEKRVVSLSLPRGPFRREVIDRHRDSLLNLARGAAAVRIRATFSDDLPTPPHAPAVHGVESMGGELWVEALADPNHEDRRWYVVEPNLAAIIAHVDVPRNERVLGGNGRAVALLTQTELGVEVVVVRGVERVEP